MQELDDSHLLNHETYSSFLGIQAYEKGCHPKLEFQKKHLKKGRPRIRKLGLHRS